MPDLRTHCKMSRKRTGFDFEDLHKWIDAPHTNFGPDHRLIRHAYNLDEREYIRQYWEDREGNGWGDKAVIEWLFHIALDNISTAFKFSQSHYGKKTFNYIEIGIEETEYIHANFERLTDQILRESFEE